MIEVVKEKFTRQELYNLVWSEPMLTIAKRFAVSDTGLRKICLRRQIPVPKAGHWQKVKFNKRVKRPLLPVCNNDSENIELTVRSEVMIAVKGEPTPKKIKQRDIEERLKASMPVREKLVNPDPLVVETKKALSTATVDKWQYKGSVSCSRTALDTRLTKDHVSRALHFWDALVKGMKLMGFGVTVRNDSTYVVIGEHDFKILLRERMRREVIKGEHWDRSEYHSTGLLYFQVHSYPSKEWKDGKRTLESQISSILAHLEIAGEYWTNLRREQRIEDEERQEKERVRKELEQRKQNELSAFKNLLNQSVRWRKAVDLRLYIKEVEMKMYKNGELPEEQKGWIEWARKKADWYDPFIEAEDELMTEPRSSI